MSGYAEPTGPVAAASKYLGYYDKDKQGQTRAVRNDLGGSLPAMVQFVQNHSVDPTGNAALYMPTLVTDREALLLITPDPTLQQVESMQVSVTVNGETKGVLKLRHPDELFRADPTGTNGRPEYVYSRRAWSVVMPWNWVRPGMELRVTDGQKRTGHLAAAAIDFAHPGELVIHSIRLGMLTSPEVNTNGGQLFRSHSAQAATDYFQTIPAARMVAAYYEDLTLPEVMVSSGTIHTTSSTTTGDVYSGDMRADTSKSTFSVGINLANYGVTSSSMMSQSHPQLFQSAVIHHARGMYTNGVQSHGLSGGNGILTLWTSRGNEFSHEIGHHYGIGHYHGEVNGNRFWAAHHHDSGWGFIGHRKRMRSNLLWGREVTGGMNGVAVLDQTYRFAPDSMAGGDFTSSLSQYTHYTGYSTQTRIQPHFNKPVPAADSPTGYKKWDASTRTMVEHSPSVPNQGAVWFNSANGKFLAPRQHGVPVITLLGGYDPTSNKALIYPAARGNWGNVYDLPAQAHVGTEPRRCWIDVDYAKKPQQRIALAGRRMETNSVNKLHINLAESDAPTNAALKCQTTGQAEELLYSRAIAQYATPMPAAVIVGKEAGYSALRKIELPELDTALKGLASKTVLTLNSQSQIYLDSYAEYANELSAAGQAQLTRYQQQQDQGTRLNRWISAYADDLGAKVPAAQTAFLALLGKLGLEQQPLVPAAQTLTMGNGNCVQKNGTAVRVAGPSLCKGDALDRWILDGRGAIRSRADLSQCLTDSGGSNPVKLAACNVLDANQEWQITPGTTRIARGNRCMDLNAGYLTNNVGTLITYNCTGGANQQWRGLVASDNPLLYLLSAENVGYLDTVSTSALKITR